LSAHPENARRAPGDVGQIDPIGRGGEVLCFDDLEIGQVVNQRQKMLTGRCDVGGVVAVFISQRSREARADGFGVGDDAGDRLAQHRGQFASKRRWNGLCFDGRRGRFG